MANMMKSAHILAALVLVCGTVAARAAPSCNTHREFQAVDLSQPVTTISTKNGKTGTEAFRAIGIKTIARYYDWVDSETTCKSLFPKESDALLAAGFNIVTIFQHANSDPETFLDKTRGAKDAREALKLAGANGQPAGSAIYFAVDGVDQTIHDAVFEWRINKGKVVQPARKKRLLRADASYRKHIQFYERFRQYHRGAFGKSADALKGADILPFVKRYFVDVNRVLKADGRYRIGGYGSGATCNMLLKNKLVDFCWLAMSSGWPGSKAFLSSGRWSLAQQLTTFCQGWQFNARETVRFDFNRLKSGDVGQWNKKGKVTAAPGLPSKCNPSW
jgi:predicted small secreted protein